MAKIKFDVSSVDPADSAGGSFEDPPPGVYGAIVKDITPGFSKGDDGKPDKARPRLEVVYQITDEKYKGSRMWDYISMLDSSTWKLDQFLLAVGVASDKKRKGDFETTEITNMPVKVRVKADSQTIDGVVVYRGKVGSVMAGSDEDLDEDVEELEEDGEAEFEEEEGEETEEVDEEEGYTQEDLDELSLKDLGQILLDEFELERASVPKGKQPKIDMILEMQARTEDEEEELEEDEEELDLESMTLGDLKAKAKELEISEVGPKSKLIARIQEALEEDPF